MERIDKYISYVPNVRQKKIQRESFNVFFHYGMNTFAGEEWGNGKADPQLFNPTSQDTDQWIRTVKEAGATGVMLTCKHHDGFCLWPTKTTNYSVASSPYKNGQGDVVREVSDSCRKYGINFGVYLSPWDRSHEDYGTPNYNDTYCEQLRELMTNYGDIFCVWFDGACGSHLDGKAKQVYDFSRYYKLINELQPMASISNCGPDVRWVGNEGGIARESEWNVVPKFSFDIQTIEKNSQQDDDGKFVKKGADVVFSDLGSRKFLDGFDDFMWYPAEVDVSIRPGWFYHKSQDGMVRNLANLLKIYYTSVGGNSLLLLNLPPNKEGLIHSNDVAVMKKVGEHLRKSEKQKVEIKSITAPECEGNNSIENVLNCEFDKTTYSPISYYTPIKEQESYTISIKLAKESLINRLILVENVDFSQRVESFKIFAICNGEKKLVYKGTTIGFKRIAVFKKEVLTDSLEVVFDSVRRKPYIESIEVYEDNGMVIKKSILSKFIQWVHKVNYEVYLARENKNSGNK